jgi:hypothetical protein
MDRVLQSVALAENAGIAKIIVPKRKASGLPSILKPIDE